MMHELQQKDIGNDAAIRKEYDSPENRSFADLGYRSMSIKFTSEQWTALKNLLAEAGSYHGVDSPAGRSPGLRCGGCSARRIPIGWAVAACNGCAAGDVHHQLLRNRAAV